MAENATEKDTAAAEHHPTPTDPFSEWYQTLHAKQIIEAVFRDAGYKDPELISTTFGCLDVTTINIVSRLHRSIGCVPLGQDGLPRPDAQQLGDEVLRTIRDMKNSNEWFQELKRGLLDMRNAVNDTAAQHGIEVDTWYMSDEDEIRTLLDKMAFSGVDN